jgi:tRNA U34 5-methylaminomethyl-2-thiouridine-forming methyltransferase MnmC
MKTMMNKMYTVVATDDGSQSLRAHEFDETMHSSFGAYEEALIKYVTSSQAVEKITRNGSLTVLDVGFGIGYNLLALLTSVNGLGYVKVVSLEKDRSAEVHINGLHFDDEKETHYDKIKKSFTDGNYRDDTCSIECMFCDARQSVLALKKRGELFDVIFQDPFSPSKNPEMWSYEYMKNIASLMKNDAIVTTYSAAPQVRRAFIEAGLFVAKGPSTGMKRESTIASKNKNMLKDVLSEDEINMLLINPKSCMYSDPLLNDSREVILERRIVEMKKIREDRQARQV